MSEDQKPPHIRLESQTINENWIGAMPSWICIWPLNRLAAKLVRIVTGTAPSLLY
ncbi:hypothetical protein FHS25_005969 [Rhizobium laguerreae]|uniref:Uncharacterized protein n=1 Tax=Rhizobium laguerreae TaxID=1076926 RepID=A0AAX2QI98_9HYPH|nr:hypothetical protein [Rhizobium laguerreae]TCU21965.1 hypothetical protein EV131_1098 [Rhizobium laguerreae]